MRRARVIFGVLFMCGTVMSWLPEATVSALSQTGLVISQVYAGTTSGDSAKYEFVELQNTNATDVNITNECVYYISSSGGTTTKLGCAVPPNGQTSLWVKAGGYVTFVSNEYKPVYGGSTDGYFAGGMNPTAGHVKLVSGTGTERDRVGWGNAINSEMPAAATPANGKGLQRVTVNGIAQDTDNNANDFVAAVPALHASNVYEVVTIIDVCPNVPDAQPTMPIGYAIDDAGNCQPDSCTNITGLQISVPDGYDSDRNGTCTQHDECDNVTGIQTIVPANMIRGDANDCDWDIAGLILSEILPNAIGVDTGNEFIEIYNPTDHTVDLSLYSIKTGVSSDKTYAFPIGTTIAPGEYRAFSDSMMKFTLLNTTGRVVLNAIDGSTVGDSGVYDSPQDGESWAMIGGEWQYTNQTTPGRANAPSLIQAVDEATNNEPAPCPAGKYRNPLTGRCRMIESDAAVLATCDMDQYRNPETGRCKKIAAAVLAPCKDNQYRSEETNRCRTIQTASVQKPCKENQYRSEETNRCRNLPVSTVPDAAFAVRPTGETGMAFVGWWALGGVGLVAVGYGVWEWRREIMRFFTMYASWFTKK